MSTKLVYRFLGFGRRVSLHLLASTSIKNDQHSGLASKKLSLKAQFLVDGQTNDGLSFVDETIRIPHFEDCLYAHEGEAVGKIALGIFSLLNFCATCGKNRSSIWPSIKFNISLKIEIV